MKISSLTPEQKTRLLAELDGWKYYPAHGSICSHYLDNGKLMLPQDVKLYLTSYDAIIPLVQKLLVNEQIQIRFECALRKICLGDRTSIYKIVLLIPSQLCDAVLVATGKAEPCGSGDLLGCCWSQDRDDGSWATGCGELFVFNDGTPKENGFKFCPYCGRNLGESPYTGDIRDDHNDEYVMELSKQPNRSA